MFLVVLYICGIIWANLYGWAMALVALPMIGLSDEGKDPSVFWAAVFWLVDKYLFLTWPVIVVLTTKVALYESTGAWVAFCWVAALFIAQAPASFMTKTEEDPAIAARAIGVALGSTILFAVWPTPIFHVYGWLVRILAGVLG